jgi:hypothetical protein
VFFVFLVVVFRRDCVLCGEKLLTSYNRDLEFQLRVNPVLITEREATKETTTEN